KWAAYSSPSQTLRPSAEVSAALVLLVNSPAIRAAILGSLRKARIAWRSEAPATEKCLSPSLTMAPAQPPRPYFAPFSLIRPSQVWPVNWKRPQAEDVLA